MSSVINTMAPQTPQRDIICTVCRLKFTDAASLKLHMGTEFHLYNAKRRIAELEPISEAIFEEKKAQLNAAATSMSVTETLWKCMITNKTFKSLEKLNEHKRSKKYKKAEKEFKKANPDLQDESSFFKTFSNDVSISGQSYVSNLAKSINGKFENDQLTMEENGEVPQANVRTTLDSLRICLFDNKESEGVKKNLDYMRNKYNFTIPDVECLINLKGLLSYLAERIQLGMICLGCNKQFSSARRCQQHMIDKRHCFMNENDEEEYEEFYDYSLQYEGMFPKKPEAIEEDRQREALWAQEAAKEAETIEEVDDWSDCDEEDGPPAPEPTEQLQTEEVVSKEDPESFINTCSEESKRDKAEIGDGASSITDHKEEIEDDTPSLSSFDGSKINKGRKGKTRLEAFRQLDIEMPTILPTGEIKLPSGKIIGHRKYSNIYKQSTKVPDTRECVIIGKLIAEKKEKNRKLLALTADRDPSGVIACAKELNQQRKLQHKFEQRYQRNKGKWGMAGNKINMEYSRDQTGHLM